MSSIQIPALHPGSPDGYLTSATIFWDYFQFDAALKQIADARTRFAQPSLFAYEAGAIDENRHDLLAAVEEYVDAVLRPLPLALRVDAGAGFVEAEGMHPRMRPTATCNRRCRASSDRRRRASGCLN
jgi:hypothetical protein